MIPYIYTGLTRTVASTTDIHTTFVYVGICWRCRQTVIRHDHPTTWNVAEHPECAIIDGLQKLVIDEETA